MNPTKRPTAPATCKPALGRRHGIALRQVSLAACMAATAPAGLALPQGEVPTFGEATVSRPAPGRMDIRQTTPLAGLDWTSFSIAAGERVVVQQPSRDAVLLNRVLGDDPSLIYGSLSSNGGVWLINPRGIVFGASSRIDVGSLVASTLAIAQDDVASGRLQLGRGVGAGALRADGDIRADGSVVLVAPQLDIGGRITAPRVGLAAATEVLVDLDGDGLVFFNVRNDALESRLQMLGRVLTDGGVADLRAAARAGLAGTVLNLEGVVQARTLGVREGRIVIDGGTSGVTRIAGTLDAQGHGAGARGGDVLVQGDRILLDRSARIDASGAAGGGSVRVGGGFRGADPDVRNAAMVSVREDALLDASATDLGDAGRVIVWSDVATRFAGHAVARGGARGGNGGLVEVSGKAFLDYRGSADLTAPAGRSGTLLLDPTNILIEASAPDLNDDGATGDDLGPGGIDFADPGLNSRITAGALVSQLAAGNVELQASNDISVNVAVNSASANSLTLRGGGLIAINAPVTVGGNLTLSANDAGSATRNPAGAATVGAALSVGGVLTLSNNGGTGVHALGANLNAATLVLVGNGARTTGATWTLGGNSTVGSNITGAFPFTKAGTGSLVLTGTLAATTVTIDGGTLQAGNGGTTGVIANTDTLTVNAAGTLAVNRSGSLGLSAAVANSAPIAGSGTFRLAGGTLTLDGALPAIGAVQVAAGTLVLASTPSDGRIANGAAVTVATGAVLDVGVVQEQVGSLSLGGSLAQNGIGTLVMGDLTLTGGGNLNIPVNVGGTITAASGTSQISSTTTGATVQVNGGATLTVGNAAAFSDTAAVTVAAGGTLALAVAKPVATLDLSGTLGGDTFALTAGGGITLRAGALVQTPTGGPSLTVAAGPGSATLQRASSAATVAVNTGTLVIGTGGSLDNAAALTVAGGATLQADVADTIASLSLAGTLSGAATLSVDTLTANGAAARIRSTLSVGTASTVASGTLTVGDGATAGALTGAGTLAVDTGATLSFDRDGPIALGSIGGTGGTLRRAGGSGALTLNGTAPNITAVQVDAGRFVLADGNDNRLGDAASVAVASGATFTTGNEPERIGSLTLAGTLNGAFTLTAGGGTTLQGGGRIEFGTRLAGGTLTTTGDATLAGRYDGGLVRIESGAVLRLSADAIPSGGHIVDTANLQLLAGGTIQLEIDETVNQLTGSGTVLGPGQLFSAVYVLDNDSVNSVSTGALVSRNASRINGNVSVTGTATVETGTLTVGNGNNGGTLSAGGGIVVNAGAVLAYSRNGTVAIAQTISGDGTLRQTGGNSATGELQITGTATTAFVDVAGGTLSLAAGSGNRLSDTATVAVASGRTLRLDNAGETIGTLNLAGTLSGVGTLTATTYSLGAGATASAALGTGTLNVGGNSTLGGTAGVGVVNVNAGTLTLGATGRFASTPSLAIAGGASLLLNGNETVGSTAIAGTLDRSAAGNRLVASAAELQAGASVVADLTGGPLTVTGNAAMSGASGAATVAVNAGTFTLGAPNVLAGTASVTVASGAGLAIGANAQSVNAFSSGGALTGSATLQSATGYVLEAGASVAANLGSGALAVNGDASLAGTAASATVDVNGGTFTLAGNNRLAATAAVTVDAGAALALGGDLTVATLALTGSVSGSGRTLTAATTTFNAGAQFGANLGPGTLVVDGSAGLSGTAGSSALVINAGTLTLGAANRFTATPSANIAGTLATAGNEALGALAGSGDITLGGGTLSAGGAADSSFSGRVLGSGNLRKTGSGTLLLSGASAYGGSTQIAQGVLRLGGDERLPNTTALTVDAGAALRADHSETVAQATIAGTLQGTGTLTAATYALNGGTVASGATLGTGTLTSTGSSQLAGRATAGTVQVNAGTLTLATADRLDDNANVAVAAGATLNLGAHETVRSLALAGTLDGVGFTLSTGDGATLQAGALARANLGSGLLVVSGNAQLVGSSAAAAVDVQAGTLSLAAAERLLDTASVTVASGATLTPGGAERVGTLALAGTLAGTQRLDATTVTLQSGALLQADVAADSLLVQGNATLQGQALVGTAQISAGTLTLAAPERIANTAALTLAAGATLQLGSHGETVAGATLAGTLAGSGTLTAATVSLAGATIDANLGSGTLTSTGATALNGTAAATSVDVTAGTLTLGAANRLADTAVLTVATGATLALAGNDTVGSLSLSGTVGGSGTLTATGGYALAGGTLQATAALGAGSLTSTGSSLLAGTAAATTVSVDGGTLALGSADRLADTAALMVAGGATLALGGNDRVGSLTLAGTLAGSGTLTAATYTLTGGTVDVPMGAGALSSSGSSRLNAAAGAATVTIAGGTLTTGSAALLADTAAVVVSPGATLRLGGTQTIGSLAGGGDIDLGAATLTTGALASSSFDGRLLGGGGLAKVGAATTFSLGGANAHTGATQVLQGTLRTTAANVLPDAGTLTVAAGATLELGGNDTVASLALAGRLAGTGTLSAATYALDGGTVEAPLGTGALSSQGSSHLHRSAAAGLVDVVAGTLTLGSGNLLDDAALLRVATGATLVLNGNDRVGTVDAAGTITGTGQLSAGSYLLTGGLYELDLGDGALTSTGNSIFNGTSAATTVTVSSGQLTLLRANTFSAQPAVTVGAGAAMTLAGNETFGSLAGDGDLSLGGATLVTGALGDSRFGGGVSGNGGSELRKVGAGVFALAGNHGYTGTTRVDAGTLALEGTLASATIAVRGGMLALAGADRLADNAAVAVATGATLALAGSDTVGSLVLSGTLGGSGTLTAASTLLDGGTVDADLGPGALISRALATLRGTSAAATLSVETGNLALAGAGRLVATPAVSVAAGAALSLGGNETFGALTGNGLVALGAATLSTGALGDASFGGTLAGAGGGLVKLGTGTFTLASASTYTGTTQVAAGTLALAGTLASQTLQVDAGTLALGGADRLADGATVAVAAGALMTLAGNDTIGALQLAGRLAGSGTISAATYALDGATVDADLGPGALSSRGAARLAGRSEAGTVSVTDGTLTLAAAGRLGALPATTVAAGATLTTAGDEALGSLAVAGTLSGTGTLSATSYALDGATVGIALGGGALTSRGLTRLEGPAAADSVAVDTGTLTLQPAALLTALPAVTLAGGATLALGSDQALGLLAGAGTVSLGAATLSTGARGDSSFAGALTGSGGLVKAGSSRFVLSGTSSYTGTTRLAGGTLAVDGTLASTAILVDAGTLALGAAERLADGATLAVATGVTLTLAGNETVAALQLAGRLRGSGTLIAATYALDGAVVEAELGRGTLSSRGASRLDARAGANSVAVDTGTLTLGAANRLADDAAVAVAAGATLALGGNDTVASLALAGTLGGSGTLTAATYSLGGGQVVADLGSGRLSSSGDSTLAGRAAVGEILVAGGTLTLSAADRVSAAPAVDVAGGGAIALGGTQTFGTLAGSGGVALGSHELATGSGGDSAFAGVISGTGGLRKQGSTSFTLSGANTYTGPTTVAAGTLRVGDGGGSGSLASSGYELTGRLVFDRSDDVTLAQPVGGSGGLTQAGSGRLLLAGGNKTYTGSTLVARGELATVGDEQLPDGSAVRVDASGRLALGGREQLQSLDADGPVALGGDLAAADDLLLRGAVTVPGNQPLTLSGRVIDATSDANRWGSSVAIDARGRVDLASGRDAGVARHLVLGRVTVPAGGRIAAGTLELSAAVAVGGAQLELVSSSAATLTAPPPEAQGRQAAGLAIGFGSDEVLQSGGEIRVADGGGLRVVVADGASVRLLAGGNEFLGGLSVTSGAAGSAWTERPTPGSFAGPTQNYAMQGRVRIAGSTIVVGGSGIEADLVSVSADRLTTAGDARIVARLPFDNTVGTAASLPALTLELTPATFGITYPYGQPGAEIRVDIGSRAFGNRTLPIDAGYLTVLPRRGASGSTAVLLSGPQVALGGYRLFFDGAGRRGEIPVFYNGLLPVTPAVENSISATVSVSENARKQRFEEAVRTENVALRLRAGVIAEVGPGRSATTGSQGLRLPALCPPAGASLACGPGN
jgi:filamentous hemagglutinin family protein